MRRAFAFVGLDDELGFHFGRGDLVTLDLGGAGLFLHDFAVGSAAMAFPAYLVALLWVACARCLFGHVASPFQVQDNPRGLPAFRVSFGGLRLQAFRHA